MSSQMGVAILQLQEIFLAGTSSRSNPARLSHMLYLFEKNTELIFSRKGLEKGKTKSKFWSLGEPPKCVVRAWYFFISANF